MSTTRKTGGRTEFNAIWTQVEALIVDLQAALTRYDNSARDHANIGNGTTTGRLRTNSPVSFAIAGALYNKASTDDLWNLSAETSLSTGQYKAYWLYLDSSGVATIAAGTVAASAAAAIAALPAVTSTKSVVGVYVAGPSTNFANALAAQGTIYNGHPAVYTMTATTTTLISP